MFQAKPKKGKLQRLTTLLTEKLLLTAKFVMVKKAKYLFMSFSVSFEVKADFKTLLSVKKGLQKVQNHFRLLSSE